MHKSRWILKNFLAVQTIVILAITGGCVTQRSITGLSRQHQELKKETRKLRADVEKLGQLQKDLDEIKRLIEQKLAGNEKRQVKYFRNLQNNIADVKYKQEEFSSELAVIKENLNDNRQINSKTLKRLETIEEHLLEEIRKLKFKRLNYVPSGSPKSGDKVGQ